MATFLDFSWSRHKKFMILLFGFVVLAISFLGCFSDIPRVRVICAEKGEISNLAHELGNELDMLLKKQKINKQIDFYVGNFTEAYLPEIQNKDHINILWTGGYKEQPLRLMSSFDFVLVTTLDLKALLEAQGSLVYFFPLFSSKKKEAPATCAGKFYDSGCYAVLLGEEPMIKEYLIAHHIAFRQFDYASDETISHLLPELENISMIVGTNPNFSPNSLDLSPFFYRGINKNIPILSHNQYSDSFRDLNQFPIFFHLFGDVISYYSDVNDIEIFLSDKKRRNYKEKQATTFVSSLLTTEKMAQRLSSILMKRLNAWPKIYDSYNIISSTFAGMYNNGDYWIAKDLEKQFAKNHHFAITSFPLNTFKDFADASIYIRGGIPLREDRKRYDSVTLMYLLFPSLDNDKSFNDDMAAENVFLSEFKEEAQNVDAVAVASRSFTEILLKQGINAYYVPQFTDVSKFYPDYDDKLKSEVLFVGNKTFYRKTPQILLNHGVDVTLYGSGWGKMAKAPYIDNLILRKYYSSAKIVLNDTRDSMKKYGFVINRLFDVSACGTLLISDYMPEIEEIYGDSVPMWKTEEELVALIKYYLDPAHEKERLEKAKRAQAITLQYFTADKIAERFEEIIHEVKQKKR